MAKNPAMELAKRIRHIPPSATLLISARAKQFKKEGKDIVILAAGEPDFDTPDFIKEAAVQAIKEGFTKYTPTPGILELKQTIAEKFLRENNLSYAPEQIVVSSGAKHSLYNCFQVLIDEGQEVIIPSPFWLSYPEMVKLAGGTPVILQCRQDDGFKINPHALTKSITKNTKVLVLNSPSNPTGVVYKKEELEAIAEICVKKKVLVVSDEIYEKLVYDNLSCVSIGSLNPEIYASTITVNGVSKSFSMTGWRIGYLGAPLEISQAIGKLQDHSTSNTCSISQKAALAALLKGSDFSKTMQKEFEARRNHIVRLLDDIPQVSYIRPQGAFYVFVDISRTGLTAEKFCQKLLEEELLACIPGEGFGRKDFIRFSFATSLSEIEKGLIRFKRFVEKITG